MHVLSPFDAGAASIRVAVDLYSEIVNNAPNRASGTVSLSKGQSGTVTLSPANPAGGSTTLVFTVTVTSNGRLSVSCDQATDGFSTLILSLEVLAGANADRYNCVTAGSADAPTFASRVLNLTSGIADSNAAITATDYFGIFTEFDAASHPAGTALLFFTPSMINGMPTVADLNATLTADSSGTASGTFAPVFIDPDTGNPITPDSVQIDGGIYGDATIVGATIQYTETGLADGDTVDIPFFGLFAGIYTYPDATVHVTIAVPAPSAAFWQDTLGCVDQEGLFKLPASLYVPEVPPVPYRPYSKTCPPPPPPPHTPRWVQKTLCGTRSLYTFLATSFNGVTIQVNQITYAIPGVDLPTINSSPYDPSKPFTQPQLVKTEPYCVTVNVYE